MGASDSVVRQTHQAFPSLTTSSGVGGLGGVSSFGLGGGIGLGSSVGIVGSGLGAGTLGVGIGGEQGTTGS